MNTGDYCLETNLSIIPQLHQKIRAIQREFPNVAFCQGGGKIWLTAYNMRLTYPQPWKRRAIGNFDPLPLIDASEEDAVGAVRLWLSIIGAENG